MISKKKTKKISDLDEQITKVAIGLDDLEQYGRRCSLRFFGVPLSENERENTDKKIVDICHDMLDVDLSEQDIQRSHILGKYSPQSNQIIVRFKSYKTKVDIYKQKKKLKGHSIFMSEDLTKRNHAIVRKLAELKKENKIDSFWTIDTKIYARKAQGEWAIRIRNIDEAEALV